MNWSFVTHVGEELLALLSRRSASKTSAEVPLAKKKNA